MSSISSIITIHEHIIQKESTTHHQIHEKMSKQHLTACIAWRVELAAKQLNHKHPELGYHLCTAWRHMQTRQAVSGQIPRIREQQHYASWKLTIWFITTHYSKHEPIELKTTPLTWIPRSSLESLMISLTRKLLEYSLALLHYLPPSILSTVRAKTLKCCCLVHSQFPALFLSLDDLSLSLSLSLSHNYNF